MKRYILVGLAVLAVLVVSCGRHGTKGNLITWIDETETVPAGRYTGWGYAHWVGGEIRGEFRTTAGTIHVMVMDDYNWDEWKMGRSAQPEIDITGDHGDFKLSPAESGTRHVILDNTAGTSDITVIILVKYQEPDSP